MASCKDKVKEIVFITGNEDKLREFQETIKSINFTRKNIDLPELQGNPEVIVKEKARIACNIVKKPCFVDDTSLCFDDWGGLPGPYIKDFIKNMGIKNLARVLLATAEKPSAKAITSIGFCTPNNDPICIQGVLKGSICMPVGNKNFKGGWDEIFIPKGGVKSFAQMDPSEKMSISQRSKAIKEFEEFLKVNF